MLNEKHRGAQFKEKFSEPSNLNELRSPPLYFTCATVNLLTSPLQTATVLSREELVIPAPPYMVAQYFGLSHSFSSNYEAC